MESGKKSAFKRRNRFFDQIEPVEGVWVPKPLDSRFIADMLEQRAEDITTGVQQSRTELADAVKNSEGYRRKLFSHFAGVTEDQWKKWPNVVKRYADGGEIDLKIRSACDRWLGGER